MLLRTIVENHLSNHCASTKHTRQAANMTGSMSCLPLKRRRKKKKDDYYEYYLAKATDQAIRKGQSISWPFKNKKEINFLKHHGIFYEHAMYPSQESAIATTVIAEKRPKATSPDCRVLVHVKVFNRLRGSLLDKTDIEMMAKHMNNPNLVLPLKVLITRDDKFVLVSDFCDGDRIDSYMRSHSNEPEVAKDLFRQIISCMNYCHEEGYVHCNLTPVSIRVKEGAEPLVQITDFAIPAMIDKRRMEKFYCKNVCYSYEAPEVLQVDGIESKTWATTDRSNVFSLGVILYQMLTGSPPFLGKLTQIRKEISRNINFSRKIPPKAKDLLTKMLRPQPHYRPSAFVCLHHPWLCLKDVETTKKGTDNLWGRLPQRPLPERPCFDKVKEENDLPKSSPIKKELDSIFEEYCERRDRRQCGLLERPWSDMVKGEKDLVGDDLKKQKISSPFMTSKKVTMDNACTQTLCNASTQTDPGPEQVLRENNNHNDTEHKNQSSVKHLTDEFPDSLRKRREILRQKLGIVLTTDSEDTQVHGTVTKVSSPEELESQYMETVVPKSTMKKKKQHRIKEKVEPCYKAQELEAKTHAVSGPGHSLYGQTRAKESGGSQCAVERETKKSNPRDVTMITGEKKSRDMQELPDIKKKKSVSRHHQTAQDVKVAKVPLTKDDRKTEAQDIPSDRDPSLPEESSTLVSCAPNEALDSFCTQSSFVRKRSTRCTQKLYQSDPTTPTTEVDDKLKPNSSKARQRNREQRKELEAKKHQSDPTTIIAGTDRLKLTSLEAMRHHHEDRKEVEPKYYQGESSVPTVDVDEKLNSDSLDARKLRRERRKKLKAKNHQSDPKGPTFHVEDKLTFVSSEPRRHHRKDRKDLKANFHPCDPAAPNSEMDDKLSSVSSEARRHHLEKREELEAKKHQSDPNAPTIEHDKLNLTSTKAIRLHKKARKELPEINPQYDPTTPAIEIDDKLSSVSSEARRRHRKKREELEAKKHQRDPSAPTTDSDDELNLTSKARRHHQKDRKELAEINPQSDPTTPANEMDDKLSSVSSEARRRHREKREELEANKHQSDPSAPTIEHDKLNLTSSKTIRLHKKARKELAEINPQYDPTSPTIEMDDKLSSVSSEARRRHRKKREELEAKKHQRDPSAPTTDSDDELNLTSKARRHHQKDRKELAERNPQSDPTTPTNEMDDKLSLDASEAMSPPREHRQAKMHQRHPSVTATQDDEKLKSTTLEARRRLQEDRKEFEGKDNLMQTKEERPTTDHEKCEETLKQMHSHIEKVASQEHRVKLEAAHSNPRELGIEQQNLKKQGKQISTDVLKTNNEIYASEEPKIKEETTDLKPRKERPHANGKEAKETNTNESLLKAQRSKICATMVETEVTPKTTCSNARKRHQMHKRGMKAGNDKQLRELQAKHKMSVLHNKGKEISNTGFELSEGKETETEKKKTGPLHSEMSDQSLGIKSNNDVEGCPAFALNEAPDTESNYSDPSLSSYPSISEGSPFADVNQRNEATSNPSDGLLSKPNEDLVEVQEEKNGQKEKIEYEKEYSTPDKKALKKKAKLEKKAKKEEKRQQKEQKKAEDMQKKELKKELKKEEKRAKKLAKTNLKRKECSAEAMEGTVERGEAKEKRSTEIQATTDTSKDNAERGHLDGEIDNKTENLQLPIDTPISNAVAQEPEESICEPCPKGYKTSKEEKKLAKKVKKLEKKAKKEEKRQKKKEAEEQKEAEDMQKKELKKELKKEEKRAKKLAKTNLKRKECSAEAMEGTVERGEAKEKRSTEIQATTDTSKNNAETGHLDGEIDNKTENLQLPIDTPISNAVAQGPEESICEQCPKGYKTSKEEKKLAKKVKKLEKKAKKEEKRQKKKEAKKALKEKEILTKEKKEQHEKQAKAEKQAMKSVMNDTEIPASDIKRHVTNGEDVADSRTVLTDEEEQRKKMEEVHQGDDENINEIQATTDTSKENAERVHLDGEIDNKTENLQLPIDTPISNAVAQGPQESVCEQCPKDYSVLTDEEEKTKKMEDVQQGNDENINEAFKASKDIAAQEKKEAKKIKKAQKKEDKKIKEEVKTKEAEEKEALKKEAKKKEKARKMEEKAMKAEIKAKAAIAAKENKAMKKEEKKRKEAQKKVDKTTKEEVKAKEAMQKKALKKEAKKMKEAQKEAEKAKKVEEKKAKKEAKKNKKELKKDRDHVPESSSKNKLKDDPEEKRNAENLEPKSKIVEEEKTSKDVASKPVVVTSQDRLLEATIAAYKAKCAYEYTRTPVVPFVAEDSDSEDEREKVIHEEKPPKKPALAWT